MTGPPASGKTTLARAIADDLRLPLYTKDTFKELLDNTLGVGDLEWSAKLGSAAMELLSHVIATEIDAGHSLVAEANFRRIAPAFVRARVVQVYCTTPEPPRAAVSSEYAPLELGGRRFVYSIGHDVDALVARVRECL